MTDSRKNTMSSSDDSSTPSVAQNTGSALANTLNDVWLNAELSSLRARVDNCIAQSQALAAVAPCNTSVSMPPVTFVPDLGLTIDWQSRVVTVDRYAGIFSDVAELQHKVSGLRGMVDELHGLFVEMNEQLTPLLTLLAEKELATSAIRADIAGLEAKKQKLMEEVSELNLLL